MDRALISQLRRSASVRTIARAWRAFAPNRTLLACSGGADSSALVLALAAAVPAGKRPHRLVVAHIIHDLRPAPQALADAARARDLAHFCGVEYVSAEVYPQALASGVANGLAQGPAHGPGATNPRRNLESLARRERYASLISLARAHACDTIATAHHADDQAETILMRLLRGTSIEGLRAIHASRTLAVQSAPPNLDTPIRLIRPMLAVTRADTEAICAMAHWQWGTDHTNVDTSRTRAWLRHEVLPLLESRSPGVSQRLATLAEHAAGASDALRLDARNLWRRARVSREAHQIVLHRDAMRTAPSHIAAMVLRHAIRSVCEGQRLDRLSARSVTRAIDLIHDRVGGERQIRLAGASITITREHVRVSRAPTGQESSFQPLAQPPAQPPAAPEEEPA